jgi:solute carrier family 25 carnitine/acylcarnitine transporter 20/29
MPLASTGIMQALNFAVYGSVKHKLTDMVNIGDISYLQSVFLAGAASGGVMSILATPIQVIKIQYQTDITMTFQRLKHKLLSGTKVPLIALYRGYWITAIGDVFGRGLYMYSYEGMKLYLSSQPYNRDTIARHNDHDHDDDNAITLTHKMLAAGFAGSFTWFALFPIDVIKTRVQAELYGESSIHHLRIILSSSDAISQLYRGCLYAVIRAAPVAATILPMYEFLNDVMLKRLK